MFSYASLCDYLLMEMETERAVIDDPVPHVLHGTRSVFDRTVISDGLVQQHIAKKEIYGYFLGMKSSGLTAQDEGVPLQFL